MLRATAQDSSQASLQGRRPITAGEDEQSALRVETDKKCMSERSELTQPVDITDPKLVKAYAHPLRIQILTLLDNRIASPSEIAAELGTPLSNTSYHVRQLAALGFVELVRRTARRGAIEHHYTAKLRPTVWDEVWAQLPKIVKRAYMGGLLQESVGEIAAAAEEGRFDREDIHYTRTAGRLDRQGWETISDELARTLKRVERIVAESEARLAKDPDADVDDAMIVMMHFPRASLKGASSRASSPGPADADCLALDESSAGAVND
jgi:DNA-binding transcriptional ArsR family regulator